MSITPPMRRHERQLTATAARELLEQGEWGVLALVDPEGEPYAVPMSYALESLECQDAAGEAALPVIVLHMAKAGRKFDCLAHARDTAKGVTGTFTVVGATEVLPSQFSTRYASVMVSGKLVEITDEDEKVRLLLRLTAKYSPGFDAKAEAYARSAMAKTGVWVLQAQSLSAKGRS